MIVINLILDILINNYTIFSTFLVLSNLYLIPKDKYYLLILISLYIDIVIMHTYILNLIIFNLIYWLEVLFFSKKESIIRNIFINTLNYIIYIVVMYFILNYNNVDLHYLLKFMSFNYPIYLIYLIISYKFFKRT